MFRGDKKCKRAEEETVGLTAVQFFDCCHGLLSLETKGLLDGAAESIPMSFDDPGVQFSFHPASEFEVQFSAPYELVA